MTPAYKLSTSSFRSRTSYGSMLAGNTAYVEPGDFYSIATVTVGSTSVSSISFTSIPSTYTHLQIRGIARDSQTSNTDDAIYFYINGDTNSSYNRHTIYGAGTTIAASGSNATDIMALGESATANSAQNYMFAPNIIDVLDYANTNKYKTFRSVRGLEVNNSAISVVLFSSGLWRSTNAITSIELKSVGGSYNFTQYTHFALYGIKAVA